MFTVYWKMGDIICGIRSKHAEVIDHARHVFGNYEISCDHIHAASMCWRVDQCESSQAPLTTASELTPLWRVHAPSGEVVNNCLSPADAIRTVEYAAVAELYSTHSVVTTLHAALLGRRGHGILIVGPAEAGKSTLATSLWLAGYEFQGDDVTLVSADDGHLSAAPRRVSLRLPSRQLLGNELWDRLTATPSFLATAGGCLFHPHELDGSQRGSMTLEPLLIIFLARRGVELAPAEVRRLSHAELLVSLAPYSNVVRTAGMGVSLERLQPLAVRAVGYDLGRGSLPSMVAAIDELFLHHGNFG